MAMLSTVPGNNRYYYHANHRNASISNKTKRFSVSVQAAATGTKTILEEVDLPTKWYNILADLPCLPPPALHPHTRQPLQKEDLEPLFPVRLIEQEMSVDRYIDIPIEVLEVYQLWRPTPLYRAKRLEKVLETPARIYYKYEGVSPAGSHKPNTAVPQAFYNAQEGIKRLTTETGAGQWGSALAFACSIFNLDCEVWQVRASYDQKPHRKTMMQTWGAKVYPSPSPHTHTGRKVLSEDPSCPGSLGLAISEAVEVAVQDPNTHYALGSVLNHVLLHQTVIGEECLKQLEKLGETPDVLIGCTGGGSNFGGLAFPFIREKIAGKMNPVLLAVEPAACPSLTKGVYAYDYGDSAGYTPLMKMHTLGHEFIPDPIHAGGLRYHGMSPLISHLYNLNFLEPIAIAQTECFQGALQFARSEGIIPAPEPAHAIAAMIREAIKCRESGKEKVIVMALCGHGHFDLAAYDKFLTGHISDLDYSQDKVNTALASFNKGKFLARFFSVTPGVFAMAAEISPPGKLLHKASMDCVLKVDSVASSILRHTYSANSVLCPRRSADIRLVARHNDVYEPCDDSFALVDALLADRIHLTSSLQPKLCVEIGCGSGYVISSLILMLRDHVNAHYVATDVNPAATEVTMETLRLHGVSSADVVQTDLVSGLDRRLAGNVDLLVFNPPYVPTPNEEVGNEGITGSWAGGDRGRVVIDRLLGLVDNLMSNRGWFYLVTLTANSPGEICRIMQSKGFSSRIVVQRQTEEESLHVLKFWRENVSSFSSSHDSSASPMTCLPRFAFWK